MSDDEQVAHAASRGRSEDAIRKNMHAILRLLAAEVARRLSCKGEDHPNRDQRSSRENRPSASQPRG